MGGCVIQEWGGPCNSGLGWDLQEHLPIDFFQDHHTLPKFTVNLTQLMTPTYEMVTHRVSKNSLIPYKV